MFQQLLPPHFDSWSCSSSYKTKQISDSKFKIWRFLAPFGIWMDSMYSQFQIILKFSFRWKSNSSSKTFKNIKNNFLAQFDKKNLRPRNFLKLWSSKKCEIERPQNGGVGVVPSLCKKKRFSKICDSFLWFFIFRKIDFYKNCCFFLREDLKSQGIEICALEG